MHSKRQEIVMSFGAVQLAPEKSFRPVVPKLCAAAPLGAVASSHGSRELLQFFTILFFHNYFYFTDVDILQYILDTWSHMLICSAIMCCVDASFGTELLATK